MSVPVRMPAVFATVLVALAGCADQVTEPEPAIGLEDASYLNARALLVHQVRAADLAVELGEEAEYTLTITGQLFYPDKAAGAAVLRDKGFGFIEPADGTSEPASATDDRLFIHSYSFRVGWAACVEGRPTAFYTGYMTTLGTQQPTVPFEISIAPFETGGGSDLLIGGRGEDVLTVWTWVRTDLAGRAGESIVFPADLYFSPEICNTR
jgi:hypothetical protein